jgi:hypothetical protein
MCIQAIAKCLQGDVGGAVNAEANACGLGGGGGGGGGGIRARTCCGEGLGSQGSAFGAASHHGAYDGGYSRGGGSFERTTSQTRIGADGNMTHKTTHVSSSGGSDYSGFGHAGAGRGYGHADFDRRGFGDHAHLRAKWHSGTGGGFAQSGAAAGSFAAASASIMPTGLLAELLNHFGGANQQAA